MRDFLLHKLDHIFNADEFGIDLNVRAGKIVGKKSKHAYSQQKSSQVNILYFNIYHFILI